MDHHRFLPADLRSLNPASETHHPRLRPCFTAYTCQCSVNQQSVSSYQTISHPVSGTAQNCQSRRLLLESSVARVGQSPRPPWRARASRTSHVGRAIGGRAIGGRATGERRFVPAELASQELHGPHAYSVWVQARDEADDCKGIP